MSKIMKVRKEIDEIDDVDMSPIMGLFVILIPFLLYAAVFVKINLINSPFPQFSGKPSTGNQKEFILNLYIKENGLSLEHNANKNGKNQKMEISLKDKYHNLKELHSKLIDIKKYFPTEYRINIYPEPSIEYDIIVKIMDATRNFQNDDPIIYINDEQGKKIKQEYLFPDVVWMGVLS